MDKDTDTGKTDIASTPDKKPKTDRFSERVDRLRHGKSRHLRNRASLDWRGDNPDVVESSQQPQITHYVCIDELRDTIRKSRTGEVLLDGESGRGLKIYYDEQTQFAQFYPEARMITLNPNRPKGDLLNMLARELRRAWQLQNETLMNPLEFEPDEAILLNRAQQADTMLISIRVAWELKLSGEPEAWEFMAGAPYSDITRIYEVHAQSDFRSLNNGEAARAAYDKWFEDNRTKMFDKRIIHQMLLDESGYMKRTDHRRSLSNELLIRLGDMPFGQNYLTLTGHRQPTDPDYAAVEDRSNANFLWFIKFERSFQEKERQMLEDSVKQSAEIVDFSRKIDELRH